MLNDVKFKYLIEGYQVSGLLLSMLQLSNGLLINEKIGL